MLRNCLKTRAIGMINKKKKFKIISASVVGAAHRSNKQPCQDYCHHKYGKNLVAVVSDGAGSAKYGKIGAKVLCNKLCDLLANADFDDIKNEIKKAIEVARQTLVVHRLNPSHNNADLELFAATAVGVVYYQDHGIFFHIGDGAALSLHDNDFCASFPENGNYSCETFFFTQDFWQKSLRFTRFSQARSIFLMSDGITSFAFKPDYSEIEPRFINPIDKFLTQEPCHAKAARALANTLADKKAQKLNPDDKTLLWIKVA